jgi:hypothetical protein
MKNKIIYTFLFTFLHLTVFSQTSIPEWTIQPGNTFINYTQDIKQVDNSNIFFTADSEGSLYLTSGYTHLAQKVTDSLLKVYASILNKKQENNQFFLQKISKNGETKWIKAYRNIAPVKLTFDNEDNLIFIYYDSKVNANILSKITKGGVELWSKILNHNPHDNPLLIKIDQFNNILLYGHIRNKKIEIEPKIIFSKNGNQHNLIFCKFNSTGKLIQKTQFQSSYKYSLLSDVISLPKEKTCFIFSKTDTLYLPKKQQIIYKHNRCAVILNNKNKLVNTFEVPNTAYIHNNKKNFLLFDSPSNKNRSLTCYNYKGIKLWKKLIKTSPKTVLVKLYTTENHIYLFLGNYDYYNHEDANSKKHSRCNQKGCHLILKINKQGTIEDFKTIKSDDFLYDQEIAFSKINTVYIKLVSYEAPHHTPNKKTPPSTKSNKFETIKEQPIRELKTYLIKYNIGFK